MRFLGLLEPRLGGLNVPLRDGPRDFPGALEVGRHRPDPEEVPPSERISSMRRGSRYWLVEVVVVEPSAFVVVVVVVSWSSPSRMKKKTVPSTFAAICATSRASW